MSRLFILDTDHITLLQHNHPVLLTHLTALPPENIAVTIVSATEQYRRDFEIISGLTIEDWSLER
jgi:hypothetical protein